MTGEMHDAALQIVDAAYEQAAADFAALAWWKRARLFLNPHNAETWIAERAMWLLTKALAEKLTADDSGNPGGIVVVHASDLRLGDVFSTDGLRVDHLARRLEDGMIVVGGVCHGEYKSHDLAPDDACPLWRRAEKGEGS